MNIAGEEVRLNEHVCRKIKEEVAYQIAEMFSGEEVGDPLRDRRWVAHFLHRSPKTIEEWQYRGWLPEPIRIGRRVFWRESTIRKIYDQMQENNGDWETH